ncbi:uncharacterized protein [Dermacentor albipictus]|uniref:uncharacterized protein isoform X2 n=1 Tax=Dermacentor albipictus TaxID=60249 RepID=UPI0038FBF441
MDRTTTLARYALRLLEFIINLAATSINYATLRPIRGRSLEDQEELAGPSLLPHHSEDAPTSNHQVPAAKPESHAIEPETSDYFSRSSDKADHPASVQTAAGRLPVKTKTTTVLRQTHAPKMTQAETAATRTTKGSTQAMSKQRRRWSTADLKPVWEKVHDPLGPVEIEPTARGAAATRRGLRQADHPASVQTAAGRLPVKTKTTTVLRQTHAPKMTQAETAATSTTKGSTQAMSKQRRRWSTADLKPVWEKVHDPLGPVEIEPTARGAAATRRGLRQADHPASVQTAAGRLPVKTKTTTVLRQTHAPKMTQAETAATRTTKGSTQAMSKQRRRWSSADLKPVWEKVHDPLGPVEIEPTARGAAATRRGLRQGESCPPTNHATESCGRPRNRRRGATFVVSARPSVEASTKLLPPAKPGSYGIEPETSDFSSLSSGKGESCPPTNHATESCGRPRNRRRGATFVVSARPSVEASTKLASTQAMSKEGRRCSTADLRPVCEKVHDPSGPVALESTARGAAATRRGLRQVSSTTPRMPSPAADEAPWLPQLPKSPEVTRLSSTTTRPGDRLRSASPKLVPIKKRPPPSKQSNCR